jgi:hypothetical protein
MKKKLSFLVVAISLLSSPVFSQDKEDQTNMLGLPGDNLDLYAVLTLFQKSETIEGFEKSLNDEQTKINNLDLNLDKKVDFIKVETKQKDKDFTFILQVDVAEKEKQDVAVILVSKDKNEKVTMQIVGDEALYGKNYVVEPKPATTPNPGYTGTQPATAPATEATVVVVESAPIVKYVYSPVYVPYYPPYYYAYYPPYYTAFAVMAVSIYHTNNYYYHAGYHGGYGNTTVIVNNTNNYNNYNKSKNTSNTVKQNNVRGNYGGGNQSSANNLNNNKASANNLNSNTKPSTNNLSNSKPSTNNRPTASNMSASPKPSSMSGGGRSAGLGRKR